MALTTAIVTTTVLKGVSDMEATKNHFIRSIAYWYTLTHFKQQQRWKDRSMPIDKAIADGKDLSIFASC